MSDEKPQEGVEVAGVMVSDDMIMEIGRMATAFQRWANDAARAMALAAQELNKRVDGIAEMYQRHKRLSMVDARCCESPMLTDQTGPDDLCDHWKCDRCGTEQTVYR